MILYIAFAKGGITLGLIAIFGLTTAGFNIASFFLNDLTQEEIDEIRTKWIEEFCRINRYWRHVPLDQKTFYVNEDLPIDHDELFEKLK